jgi:VWFA-related protein
MCISKSVTRYFVGLFISFGLLAQEDPLRVQTRLVIVPVLISNGSGRPLADLPAERFKLLDNGVPQPFSLETFGTGVAPIALMVAVQNSGISASALAKVHQVGSMIQPLITGERGCAGLVTFAEKVVWRQECTKDPFLLSNAFARIGIGEERKGRMLDASLDAIRKLATIAGSRRVLLLISESRDRGGSAELEEVIAAAQMAGVTVYAATYSAFRTGFVAKPEEVQRPRQKPKDLNPAIDPNMRPGLGNGGQKAQHPNESNRADLGAGIEELIRLGQIKTTEALARATGGTEFPFTRLSGLESAIEKLGEELHAQYVLSFTPKDPLPGYHSLAVTVSEPNAKIRARPGYWANASR